MPTARTSKSRTLTPSDCENFPLFQNIETRHLEAILASSKIVEYDANAIVLEEGEPDVDAGLYVILEGKVEVLMASPRLSPCDPDHKRLATLETGDVFGEIALLRGKRRSARIQALVGLRVLKIDGPTLSVMFVQDMHFGFRLMRNLATMLSDRLVDLNFKLRNGL